MTCPPACAECRDPACEQRVTWKPDARRQHPGLPRALSSMVMEERRTHSTRFRPNGGGGGDVEIATLSADGRLGIWKRAARKTPLEGT